MKDTRVHCFIFQSTVPIYIYTLINGQLIIKRAYVDLCLYIYGIRYIAIHVSQRDELEFCCVVFA